MQITAIATVPLAAVKELFTTVRAYTNIPRQCVRDKAGLVLLYSRLSKHNIQSTVNTDFRRSSSALCFFLVLCV